MKGLEKHLCKILSVGTEEEMETKMQEMEEDPVTRQPPKKASKEGKENKIQQSAEKHHSSWSCGAS